MVDERSKQDCRDSEFLIRVLGEEAILIEQIMHHTGKDFLLSLLCRAFETLQHPYHIVNTLLSRVYFLEESVGFLLNVGSKDFRRLRLCYLGTRALQRLKSRVTLARRFVQALQFVHKFRRHRRTVRLQDFEEDCRALRRERNEGRLLLHAFPRLSPRTGDVLLSQKCNAGRHEGQPLFGNALLHPLLQVQILASRSQRRDIYSKGSLWRLQDGRKDLQILGNVKNPRYDRVVLSVHFRHRLDYSGLLQGPQPMENQRRIGMVAYVGRQQHGKHFLMKKSPLAVSALRYPNENEFGACLGTCLNDCMHRIVIALICQVDQRVNKVQREPGFVWRAHCRLPSMQAFKW
mmetsp:Transcript_518/g.1829  ORF Transcript_518/g.1829 Transcript_518/m.1829 type:complete len:347 (+) Transcript_518:8693-9733(+)